MLLEKLKENGGKIMFFIANILVVVTGVFFIKQKNVEKVNAAISQADVENYKSAADYALDVQKRIIADQQGKLNLINSNPDMIKREQTVSVARTIPAVTKTVTVQRPAAKTTTKKS